MVPGARGVDALAELAGLCQRMTSSGAASLPNRHLTALDSDTLYHLGITAHPGADRVDPHLAAAFGELARASRDACRRRPTRTRAGDVRFVVMGGSAQRMEEFSRRCARTFARIAAGEDEVFEVYQVSKTERFTALRVGPVMCISHGMGFGSISVCLHEVAKLLAYAGVMASVTLIRVGTCGGIGVAPGTVVVSTSAVNGMLKEVEELEIVGRKVERPAVLDKELAGREGGR